MKISPVKVWRHQKQIASLLGQEGKVVSWTLIEVPPAGYESEAPYPVVIVKLDKGGRMTGQLVDWEEKNLKIGQKVKVVYRRIRKPDEEGVIPYGAKFSPC